MRLTLPNTRIGLALALAALLLVVGLLVEREYAHPMLERIANLQSQRQEGWAQLRRQEDLAERSERLAARLGFETLNELAASAEIDPVSYLGGLIEKHGLVRLDLRNMGGQAYPALHRTDLNLIVTGRYARIQDFMQDLETGRRLTSIESFTIRSRRETTDLEGRFNISVYDPTGDTTP